MIGFLDAILFAPLSLLVLECVGQRSVNKAWGIFHAAVNVSSAAGPPIAGWCTCTSRCASTVLISISDQP